MNDLAAGDSSNPGEILTLTAHDRSYSMYDTGGKISKCMRVGKPYEAPLLEHIYERRANGELGDLAIDVGANIGNHSLWLAVMCQMKVVAIEPVQTQLLYQHVVMNELIGRITVIPGALGKEMGVATHQGKGVLEVLDPPQVIPVWEKEPFIRVSTLDSWKFPRVSLIKIDVEGMEADVIAGGMETITRDGPSIYAEFWNRFYRRNIEAYLKPLGYELVQEFVTGGTTKVGRWESL